LGIKRPDWKNPSAEWIKRCELLVAREAQLPAVLAGTGPPPTPRERHGYIEVCRRTKRYTAAARLAANAFAADPKSADDLETSFRYNAACYAALAAAGQGRDAPPPADRPALRRQAFGWLRADLAGWQKRLAADPAKARDIAHKTMSHWLADADLGLVRHPLAVGLLPADERTAWTQLWADVRNLRDRTRPSRFR
jgi:hypothetical protein